MVILIVDDEKTSAILIREKLIWLGITPEAITTAISLKEADDILHTRYFDIVFLDLFFPDTEIENTFEFIQNHPKETIIITSGADDPKVILECTKLGVRHFISKAHCRIEDFRRALEYAKG